MFFGFSDFFLACERPSGQKKANEKDKYDKQIDNVVDEHPPGSYELAFDAWAKQPNHDPDTRPTITTPGYAH